MPYILTLQIDGETLADYDKLIEFEDRLSEVLADGDFVDGHDMGSHEMNLFIVTETPHDAFQRIMNSNPELRTRSDLKAAFREADGEEYTVLWPESLRGSFKTSE